MDHHVFKALSEPVRLRIAVLLTEGELCVCDLTDALSLPQSTVSRHMARLKNAGLVGNRRLGKWIHYELKLGSDPLARALRTYLSSVRGVKPHRHDLVRLNKHRKDRPC